MVRLIVASGCRSPKLTPLQDLYRSDHLLQRTFTSHILRPSRGPARGHSRATNEYK
jgi:hypothetical protein